MTNSHQQIVAFVRAGLVQGADVLDLGCGNGALLFALREGKFGVRVHGIEVEQGLADRRVRRLVEGDRIVCGNMFDDDYLWDRHYDVVLLMPGRLVEASPKQRERLKKRLSDIPCLDIRDQNIDGS